MILFHYLNPVFIPGVATLEYSIPCCSVIEMRWDSRIPCPQRKSSNGLRLRQQEVAESYEIGSLYRACVGVGEVQEEMKRCCSLRVYETSIISG